MNGYEPGYRRLFGKHFLVDTASYYNHYHDLFDEEFAGPIVFEFVEPGVSDTHTRQLPAARAVRQRIAGLYQRHSGQPRNGGQPLSGACAGPIRIST